MVFWWCKQTVVMQAKGRIMTLKEVKGDLIMVLKCQKILSFKILSVIFIGFLGHERLHVLERKDYNIIRFTLNSRTFQQLADFIKLALNFRLPTFIWTVKKSVWQMKERVICFTTVPKCKAHSPGGYELQTGRGMSSGNWWQKGSIVKKCWFRKYYSTVLEDLSRLPCSLLMWRQNQPQHRVVSIHNWVTPTF